LATACAPSRRRRSSIDHLSSLAAFDLATGDAIIGTEAQPGSEVLCAWELTRIKAYFGKDGLDSQDMKAVDLSEIHAADTVQMGT